MGYDGNDASYRITASIAVKDPVDNAAYSQRTDGSFDAYMLELFIEKMLVHVRSVFPEQTNDKSKKELRDLVEDGIKRASVYDITEEPQVALFIDLMLDVSHDFDSRKDNEWITSILKNEQLDPAVKLDLIYTLLEEKEP